MAAVELVEEEEKNNSEESGTSLEGKSNEEVGKKLVSQGVGAPFLGLHKYE